jgi:uncharacterized membrane protein YbhN (UPF0104 family)
MTGTRRVLLISLSLLVGGAAVWWLFTHQLHLYDRVVDGKPEDGLITLFGRLPAWTPVAVVVFTAGALALQAVRLRVLMQSVGHAPTFFACLRAHLIGLFYGNIIPAGQIGGDPIKAVVLAKSCGAPVSDGFAATLVDRVVGLAVLAGISLPALLARAGDARYRTLAMVVGGIAAALIVVAGLLLSRRARRASGASWVAARLPGSAKISAAGAVLARFGRSKKHLAQAVLLSLAAQLLLIGAAASVCYGLGVEEAGFTDFLIIVPPASVVTSLPFSAPGGWGVGETVYIEMFRPLGVAENAAFMFSAVPRLGLALLSLLGLPAAIAVLRKRKPEAGAAAEAVK